jgi:hypothetical protein
LEFEKVALGGMGNAMRLKLTSLPNRPLDMDIAPVSGVKLVVLVIADWHPLSRTCDGSPSYGKGLLNIDPQDPKVSGELGELGGLVVNVCCGIIDDELHDLSAPGP